MPRLIDADALIEKVRESKVISEMVKPLFIDTVMVMPTVGGWVSVKDRLPEKGVTVLTAVYGTDVIMPRDGESITDAIKRSLSRPGRVEVGFLDEDGYWTDYAFGGPMIISPTYWTPMPEPPKEDCDDQD